MVLRVDTHNAGATVVYHYDDQFYQASARAVIVAGQGYTAQHLVEHLLDEATRQAWQSFVYVPVLTANVVLRRASSLVDLGLGYNNYWWGSQYWADFVIADWVTPQRDDPERPTVLTVYGANTQPPNAIPYERVKLLTTPFACYEASLRDDLNRILGSGGFDFDRDVSAVYLYRWGHGMVFPTVGCPFGVPQQCYGRTIRTPAPRHLARRQLGRISFAGQDTESSPAVESAIASGLRTAQEVLALL
jgi:hypothetical protein